MRPLFTVVALHDAAVIALHAAVLHRAVVLHLAPVSFVPPDALIVDGFAERMKMGLGASALGPDATRNDDFDSSCAVKAG